MTAAAVAAALTTRATQGVRGMCGMQAAPSGYLYECVSMPPAAESSSSVAQRGHRVMKDDAGIAADDIGGGGG